MLASPCAPDQVVTLAIEHHEYSMPAYINRDLNSLLSNLVYIPVGLFSCVEISSFSQIYIQT